MTFSQSLSRALAVDPDDPRELTMNDNGSRDVTLEESLPRAVSF
jgi:hypothetical protein